MSRKAILISEESADSIPESPLRRSTRTRITNSPVPIATVGRTRRNSSSSVDSIISANSIASAKVTRGRRPSLSKESTLDKVEEKRPEEMTPVKRTRRGSISSLQDDAIATTRAGSPAVTPSIGNVTERRRSLRSASRSPTSELKSSVEPAAPTEATPKNIRSRRSSAEKTAPKRRGSVTLEVLDEENETVDSPNKSNLPTVSEEVDRDEAGKNTKLDGFVKQTVKTYEDTKISSTKNINLEKDTSRSRRSSEKKAAKVIVDSVKTEISEVSSRSSTISANLENNESESRHSTEPHKTEDDLKGPESSLRRKVQDQIQSNVKVVISPLYAKVSPEKLNEITELVMKVPVKYPEPVKSDTVDLTNDIKEIDRAENSVFITDSSANLEKKIFNISSTEESFETTLTDAVKMSPKSSPKRTSLKLQSPLRKSPRLNSENESIETCSKSSSPIMGEKITTPKDSVNFSKTIIHVKETVVAAVEVKSPIKSLNDSREVVDGSDGSFNLSLKSSLLSSQEDLLNKSSILPKDKKAAEQLNTSNESDKENVSTVKTTPAKLGSNVFSAKDDVEESFFEAMDVDYPTDNDESLSISKGKRDSMNKAPLAQAATHSDDSSSGSLHLVCSDENGETKPTKPKGMKDARQSIALIQLNRSPVTIGSPQVLDGPRTLLDSRISILPSRTLKPLQTMLKIDSLKETLKFDDDESEEEILAINTENMDGSEHRELIDTKATEESMNDSPISEQRLFPIHREEMDLECVVESTDEETDTINEQEPGMKLNDLDSDDSQDSSDTEYRPELDEAKEVNEEYKSSTPHDTEEETENPQQQEDPIDNQEPGMKLNDLDSDDRQDSSDTEYRPELDEATEVNEEYKSSTPHDTEEENGNPQQQEDPNDKQQCNISKQEIATSPNNNKLKIISVHSSLDTSKPNIESKLRELILNKTIQYNDETDSSDSEYVPNKMFNDEAIEVSGEETPSDDSNEIIDVGDNIEDTDDELEDEEVVSGSDEDFIDDDDDVAVLLSGNEDDNDLDYDGKEVVRKKRRIAVRPVDESEEDDDATEKKTDEPEETEINKTEEVMKEEKADSSLDTSISKRKKKRNRSLSFSEKVRKDDVDNSQIVDNIKGVVEQFYSQINYKRGGNVEVNVSIDYEDSSSSNGDINPEPILNVTRQSTKSSLKRKSSIAGACDSSTTEAKSPKIEVLHEFRIAGDDVDEQVSAEISEPTKSIKKGNRGPVTPNNCQYEDDDVFLPNEVVTSTRTDGLAATPRPSNIAPLPDNVICQLVEQEATTSKHNVKTGKNRNGVQLCPKEVEKYCRPSTSAATSSGWNVKELDETPKPSKRNKRMQNIGKVEPKSNDPKDYRFIMIAKNKPKVNKKSFKDTLKTQKKF